MVENWNSFKYVPYKNRLTNSPGKNLRFTKFKVQMHFVELPLSSIKHAVNNNCQVSIRDRIKRHLEKIYKTYYNVLLKKKIGEIYLPVWFQYWLRSAGLEPVMKHTENHLTYRTTDIFYEL